MKRRLTFCLIGLLMSIAGSQSVTKAALHTVIGGTDAPTSTLGPYTVTPFAKDLSLTNPKYSVESPLGGNVFFLPPLEHLKVSVGWMTWSHGYSGDVYYVSDKTKTDYLVTLMMPENTTSFYFYAQPKEGTVNTISAMVYDGVDDMIDDIDQIVSGDSGASYFGFYATGGSTIYNINIYSNEVFAIGEFGISAAVPVTVPVPGAFILSNIGLCTLIKLRKHRFFKKVM